MGRNEVFDCDMGIAELIQATKKTKKNNTEIRSIQSEIEKRFTNFGNAVNKELEELGLLGFEGKGSETFSDGLGFDFGYQNTQDSLSLYFCNYFDPKTYQLSLFLSKKGVNPYSTEKKLQTMYAATGKSAKKSIQPLFGRGRDDVYYLGSKAPPDDSIFQLIDRDIDTRRCYLGLRLLSRRVTVSEVIDAVGMILDSIKAERLKKESNRGRNTASKEVQRSEYSWSPKEKKIVKRFLNSNKHLEIHEESSWNGGAFIYPDLLIQQSQKSCTIVEAKASSESRCVREAIGQLLHYKKVIADSEEYSDGIGMAILVPHKILDKYLRAVLKDHEIRVLLPNQKFS